MREILRRERLNKHLSQKELAEMSGISRVHYTQIENCSNNKSPSLDVAIRIKKALGYNKDDLFAISTAPKRDS
jgi:transcriptional regulator with XRE-family HTH domain